MNYQIQIEMIDSSKSSGIMGYYSHGFATYSPLENIIRHCSYYLDKKYGWKGNDDIHLFVNYMNMDLSPIRQREVSQIVIKEVVKELNLHARHLEKPEKGLELDIRSLRDIPFTESDENNTKIECDINSFIINLNYVFGVHFVSVDWEEKEREKITLNISKEAIQNSIGDVEAVKALLANYSIKTKIVDIEVIELSPK